MENDHKGDAELAKWRRKLNKIEDDYQGAERNLKDYLKAAIGSYDKGVSKTRLNLARELKRSENEKPLREGEGFQRTQEGEITGMEDFPWNRDIE